MIFVCPAYFFSQLIFLLDSWGWVLADKQDRIEGHGEMAGGQRQVTNRIATKSVVLSILQLPWGSIDSNEMDVSSSHCIVFHGPLVALFPILFISHLMLHGLCSRSNNSPIETRKKEKNKAKKYSMCNHNRLGTLCVCVFSTHRKARQDTAHRRARGRQHCSILWK